jgi:hypothetical protein
MLAISGMKMRWIMLAVKDSYYNAVKSAYFGTADAPKATPASQVLHLID